MATIIMRKLLDRKFIALFLLVYGIVSGAGCWQLAASGVCRSQIIIIHSAAVGHCDICGRRRLSFTLDSVCSGFGAHII